MNQRCSFSKESTKLSTIADEVAAKAKRVFQLMVSQDGKKAFGSVLGTDILITIERVDSALIRPAWWPADFDWPPTLSDAEAMRAVAEGIPTTPEDVAAEELRQQREGTFELPESLRDASKVLERIKEQIDSEPVDEYDHDNDCPRCQGSGEAPTADYESYFGQNYKPCPMCGGNGDR